MHRLSRRLATMATHRVIEAAKALRQPGGASRLPPDPPLPSDVRDAVADTVARRNGYQAWSLYAALQQIGVPLIASQTDALAGTMLHVDHELHADVAARRTLSVLDAERQAGRTPSRDLLAHGAAACALRGLPELAEALCTEAEAREPPAGGRFDMRMRASLIGAFGVSKQLRRAFAVYRALEEHCSRRPPAQEAADALVRACVSADEVDTAHRVFDSLRTLPDFRVTASPLVALLRGCVQMGDVARASELLAAARALGVEVRSAAVREFARAPSDAFLDLACALHREAIDAGAPMPLGSSTKLVRACIQHSRETDAEEVLFARRAAQPPPADHQEHYHAHEPHVHDHTRDHHERHDPRLRPSPVTPSTVSSSPSELSLSELGHSLDVLHSLARQERQPAV